MNKDINNTNQDIENLNEEDYSESILDENFHLFKRALSEGVEAKFNKIREEIGDDELPPPSKRYKIRMNRLFRERVGGSFLPFPEADCFYERVRSKIVVKLKINEFLDKCKEHRRTS